MGLARAELALALARLADSGSVPAIKVLRELLTDLGALDDEARYGEFWRSISSVPPGWVEPT